MFRPWNNARLWGSHKWHQGGRTSSWLVRKPEIVNYRFLLQELERRFSTLYNSIHPTIAYYKCCLLIGYSAVVYLTIRLRCKYLNFEWDRCFECVETKVSGLLNFRSFWKLSQNWFSSPQNWVWKSEDYHNSWKMYGFQAILEFMLLWMKKDVLRSV